MVESNAIRRSFLSSTFIDVMSSMRRIFFFCFVFFFGFFFEILGTEINPIIIDIFDRMNMVGDGTGAECSCNGVLFRRPIRRRIYFAQRWLIRISLVVNAVTIHHRMRITFVLFAYIGFD